MRYRVGFEYPATCDALRHVEQLNGADQKWTAVVDTDTANVFGRVAALCPTEEQAQRVCNALNATEVS